MSNSFGNNIKISIFGQSHSDAIGVVIDNLPAGIKIDMQNIKDFMKRRAPGNSVYSTPRKEEDIPKIISGVFNDMTCGAPLCAIIENKNTRSQDYDLLKDIPRPAHADYTAYAKYNGHWDYRGGGHFSGRLTAPLCFAGAIVLQILNEKYGIKIAARIKSICDIEDDEIDTVKIDESILNKFRECDFSLFNKAKQTPMQNRIMSALKDNDSVGGIIECFAINVPIGVGSPMFEGIEGKLANIIYGIPAVKGVEFGSGFAGTRLRGSQNNDGFIFKEYNEINDRVILETKSNNHGGILGGISTGMPIVVRAAIKPTPSIEKTQNSVSLSKHENVELSIKGRHDPCIVPRAVPCIESAVAIGLYDLILANN